MQKPQSSQIVNKTLQKDNKPALRQVFAKYDMGKINH